MLRLGLGLLKKVKPIAQPWLAIIGHSIDIGTKKALVILRVRADILSRKEGAIQLQDCECIGLRISETVNGNSVALESGEIFQHAGTPAAIIKDCDRTLNKGVNLWQEKQELDIPVIEDISHVMASALKKQYEDTEGYRNFTSLISKSAKNLRQTALAFLAPPKLRTKGRFLSIGRLGRWGERILDLLDVGKDRKDDDSLNKVRAALPDINDSKSFIQSFAGTAKTVSQVMELLKNKGLNNSTFSECHSLMEKLSDAQTVKKSLRDWLNQHFIIRGKVTHFSLPVSSDIIESLFGRFKHMLERNPQADMNRSALLIPVLCGTLNESVIRDALNSAPHDALKKWEQDNIPYTMRKKRREFFGETKPKTGNASAGKT